MFEEGYLRRNLSSVVLFLERRVYIHVDVLLCFCVMKEEEEKTRRKEREKKGRKKRGKVGGR